MTLLLPELYFDTEANENCHLSRRVSNNSSGRRHRQIDGHNRWNASAWIVHERKWSAVALEQGIGRRELSEGRRVVRWAMDWFHRKGIDILETGREHEVNRSKVKLGSVPSSADCFRLERVSQIEICSIERLSSEGRIYLTVKVESSEGKKLHYVWRSSAFVSSLSKETSVIWAKASS